MRRPLGFVDHLPRGIQVSLLEGTQPDAIAFQHGGGIEGKVGHRVLTVGRVPVNVEALAVVDASKGGTGRSGRDR